MDPIVAPAVQASTTAAGDDAIPESRFVSSQASADEISKTANDLEGAESPSENEGIRNEQLVSYQYDPLRTLSEIDADKSGNVKTRQIQPFELENARINPVDHEENFPDGGLKAWSVVLGAFITLFPSFGFMVSIGTLQDYWHQNQLSNVSLAAIGWIPSIFVYLCLALGITVGPLFDRYGPRWLLLGGSTGYIIMMFLLAECTKYWHFMLCLGIFGGVNGAMLTTVSLSCVAHWFKKNRGLAQGVAMAGSSFGGLTVPLILRKTFAEYGYQWSIRIISFIFLGALVLGNILTVSRIPPNPHRKKQALIQPSIFLDLRFAFLTLTIFGLELVIFGAQGILPAYTTASPKYPSDTGFYVVATMNGVSCLGRLLPGYLADRIGRFNTLGIFIVFTLFWMVVLWLPFGATSLSALYGFSALFGFGTGCWMALVPSCLGQLCRAEDFGRYYGTSYFMGSLATLVCVPISGELLSVLGSTALVIFYSVVLFITLGTFCISRWACLGWKWTWMTKL